MSIERRFLSGKRLSEFSTFGIGGPIRYFFDAKDPEDLKQALLWAKKASLPYFLLGKGSNCLFDDRGFDGLVIRNKIEFCKEEGNSFFVGAGYSFALLGIQTAKKGFSGLEFAAGIPGSVGGAVYMNAGANGWDTASCLAEVVFFEETGEEKRFLKKELLFGYRHSPFQSLRGAIVAARFCLVQNNEARANQKKMTEKRIKTQPLQAKSAGCVFRNPASCHSAGALIDQCGLKGVSIGGAKISDLHANFIVNQGAATAADVMQLIELVQRSVYEKKGILLEPEVRVITFL